MKTNLKRRDYHKMEWNKKELVFTVGTAGVIVVFLAYFFIGACGSFYLWRLSECVTFV